MLLTTLAATAMADSRKLMKVIPLKVPSPPLQSGGGGSYLNNPILSFFFFLVEKDSKDTL